MTRIRIAISERDPDPNEGIIYLGSVTVEKASFDKAEKLIRTCWDKFQDTKPDCDSEYIQYLVEKYPGLFRAADDDYSIVL